MHDEVYQLPLFQTNKRCSRCGVHKPVDEFYRNSSARDGLHLYCKACVQKKNKDKYWADPEGEKAKAKRWREENPEKEKARSKAYRDANKEVIRQKDRAYYEANKARVLAQCKEYRESHKEQTRRTGRLYREANPERIRSLKKEQQRRADPERLRSRVRNRRARLRAAEGKHTAEDVHRIYEQQDGKCYWCGVVLGAGAHVDHLTPVSRGGSNWPSNLAITCRLCNQRKGNKTAEEYIEQRSTP